MHTVLLLLTVVFYEEVLLLGHFKHARKLRCREVR